MKIIRRGPKPSDRAWEGHCSKCDSDATATQSELTNITDDFRDGGQFSWEKCPVCGAGEPSLKNWGGMIFYPSKDA